MRLLTPALFVAFLAGCAEAPDAVDSAPLAVEEKAEDSLPPAPELDGTWTVEGPGGATTLHVRRVGERWFAGIVGGAHAYEGDEGGTPGDCRVETALNWDGSVLRGRNADGVEVVVTPGESLAVAAKTEAWCGHRARLDGLYARTAPLSGDALPGFDCGRAADSLQMMKCRVPALAELDQRVRASWTTVTADDEDALAVSAGRALAAREAACLGGPEDPVDCLREAMQIELQAATAR